MFIDNKSQCSSFSQYTDGPVEQTSGDEEGRAPLDGGSVLLLVVVILVAVANVVTHEL